MLLFSSETHTTTDFNDRLLSHGKTTEHHHDILSDETLFTPILSKLQTIKKRKSQLDNVERALNLSHQKVQESGEENLM